MTSYTLWLSREFISLNQASCLLSGVFPSELKHFQTNDKIREKVDVIIDARSILFDAILRGELSATQAPYVDLDLNISEIIDNDFLPKDLDAPVEHIDLLKTLILPEEITNRLIRLQLKVSEICKWVVERRLVKNYFYDKYKDDLLNDGKISKKMIAAEKVHQFLLDNPGSFKHFSVRQAAIRWLEKNAFELGLTDSNGKPINQAIEEIASVVNWDTRGGKKLKNS